MISRAFVYAAAAVLLNTVFVFAQAENRFPDDQRHEPPPFGVREMLEKMRISKEKKDYEEMMAHGDEVRRLTTGLAKSVTEHGQITNADREKLELLEKNLRKIRSELGGSDDDDENMEDSQEGRLTPSTAINTLVSSVDALMDELKRSNRFTISVPAIEASNATLRVVRFLLQK